MKIEDIKNYEQLREYCEEKGYDNLTQDEINQLCNMSFDIEKDIEENNHPIEDIKTYEELDAFCEMKGYEKLTDEDIEKLKLKVWEIEKANEERIEQKVKNPHVRMALIMFESACAANRCNHLDNCTEERRQRNEKRRWEAFNRRGGIIREDPSWERRLH